VNPPPRTPLLVQVFVWSIVLEPMLFFVLVDRSFSGVGANISRLLQLAMLVGLALRALAHPIRISFRQRAPVSLWTLYRPHVLYLLLALVAGLIGLYTGAYRVPVFPNVERLSVFSGLLNSPSVRPLFEYVVAAYYFVYFAVLPQFMLNTPRKLNYFFGVFTSMYMLSLVAGYIDIAGTATGTFEGLPRHIFEGVTVGVRFHGFAGEPRDAFVFLFFGLAMLHLRALYQQRGRLSLLLIGSVVFAMALTQSASGIVGIGMGVGLVVAYSLTRISIRQMGIAAGLVVGGATFVYLMFIASARLQVYADNVTAVWNTLESGGNQFGIFSGQMPSIYPLYDLYLKVRAGDLLPVLIGSGMGAASAVNNRYMQVVELANPASQAVRMLFEVGVIGSFLFIQSFVVPIRRLTAGLSPRRRRQFLALTLLLIGCFLGHRSSTLYIYLGAVTAVFNILNMEPMPHTVSGARRGVS
jgi:hypothetical protein